MPDREWFRLPARTAAGGGVLYDAIEIAPVAVINSHGDCEAFTSVALIPKELRSSAFWSLYGHIPGQGVECIGNFTTREQAMLVLFRMFGDLELL